MTDLDGNVTSYEYDALSQLVRENNQAAGKTTIYTYADGGNISSVKEYAYTTEEVGQALSQKDYAYASDWRDKLVAFDGGTFEYDALGNPTKYLDRNLSWNYGRLLTGITSGDQTIAYYYKYGRSMGRNRESITTGGRQDFIHYTTGRGSC